MQNLTIKFLADVPEYIPILAAWIYAEWGSHDPSLSIDSATRSLQQRLNKDKIPLAFVALKDNQAIGLVCLKPKVELPGYAARDLWVGSFIVVPEHRRQGVGTALLKHALDHAKQLGYRKASLFTTVPESAVWYAKQNWHNFANDRYHTNPASLWGLRL